jgi:hypothetical protein
MSAPIDCPICMDLIEFNKNCVTTDCGHCFHTNCLMQSVAHNGFGCPYCRTKMAEEPEEEDEFDDEEEGEEMFDDDALRGFRFFWNNINGEEHDEIDNVDEQEQLDEWEDVDEEEESEEDSNIPSPEFVAEKLRIQDVTYEDLVKIILHRDHDEYDPENEEVDLSDRELFGKMRIIISNYEHQPPAVVVPVTEPEKKVERPSEQIREVDFTAQSKTSHVRRVPTFMIHV